MTLPVHHGAILSCSMGICPSSLYVLPKGRSLHLNQPIATITDNVPMVNLSPFGMCHSLANPTVASATAAAFGVFTPMPCVPCICGLWTFDNQSIMIEGIPSLTSDSKLTCAYGGVISIINPGQSDILTKR